MNPETILGFTPGPGMHTLRVDVVNDLHTATGMDLSGTLTGYVRIVLCPTFTATPIPTLTRKPTPTRTPKYFPACVGDCNTDGAVTVEELITMVNIALGNADVSTCIAGDADGDGQITIDEIIGGVNNALDECRPLATATPTPSGFAEICVLKFNEVNGNGMQDVGESGLPGWNIEIDLGGNFFTSITTGPAGTFCTGVPAPATYTVSEVPQAGWTQTFPAVSGVHTVPVTSGQLLNLVFGNKQ